MNLYIRIKNGVCFEHPILEDNFRQAFPNVDTSNLPSNFARFTRVPPPEIGPYEIYLNVQYELQSDGSYMDVHNVRDMTEIEKTYKQDEIKAQWAENGYASWVFNESACVFESPIPPPDDGKNYTWDEGSVSWVEVT